MDDGADIPREMVAGIYERIQQRELRSNEDHVTYVSRVEQSILGLKTVSNIQVIAIFSLISGSCLFLFVQSPFSRVMYYFAAVCPLLCTSCHPYLFNLVSVDPRCAPQTPGVLLSPVRGA